MEEMLPGRQIGRYRLVSELGRGGMATVYKGVDTVLQRSVAIKVLAHFLHAVPEFVLRFNQEARTLAQLRHPGIVTLFDFGEHEGSTYLVMEYVEGGTLADRVSGVPREQAATWLTQISAALEYAHSHGVVHRDLKPSNVLLTRDGDAVLSDFGIARLLEADSRFTRTGSLLCTPEYMAPEMLLGHPVDFRADIYALGCLGFELLTGRPPYQEASAMATAMAHVNQPIPTPASVGSSQERAVHHVIHRCLQKDPDDRWRSAAEFKRALTRAIEQAPPADIRPDPETATVQLQPVSPDPGPWAPKSAPARSAPSVPSPAPRPRAPYRGLILVFFVTVLLGALAVTGWWKWSRRGEEVVDAAALAGDQAEGRDLASGAAAEPPLGSAPPPEGSGKTEPATGSAPEKPAVGVPSPQPSGDTAGNGPRVPPSAPQSGGGESAAPEAGGQTTAPAVSAPPGADRIKPEVVIEPISTLDEGSTAAVRWRSEDSQSGVARVLVQYQIDGGPTQVLYDGNGSVTSAEVRSTTPGTYRVTALAWDKANNQSAEMAQIFTVRSVVRDPGLFVGDFGNRLQLGGGTGYVFLPESPMRQFTTAFTAEARFYPQDNANQWSTLMSGSDWYLEVQTVSDKKFRLRLRAYLKNDAVSDPNWTINMESATRDFPMDRWYHVAIAYSRTSFAVIINGEQVSGAQTGPGEGIHLSPRGTAVAVGTKFSGMVDEVRLWNRRLSDEEIKRNVNRQLTGAESGLVGYWRFDEGSGSTAADASAAGTPAELRGAVWSSP